MKKIYYGLIAAMMLLAVIGLASADKTCTFYGNRMVCQDVTYKQYVVPTKVSCFGDNTKTRCINVTMANASFYNPLPTAAFDICKPMGNLLKTKECFGFGGNNGCEKKYYCVGKEVNYATYKKIAGQRDSLTKATPHPNTHYDNSWG